MDIARRPATHGRPPARIALPEALAGLRGMRGLRMLALALLIAVVGAAVWLVHARATTAISFTTVPIGRGDLVASVTATGTVNPQNTVAVGTQESGTVSAVYVDYNAHVKRGAILARLDPTTFQAALDQERAILEQTQAQARAAAATAVGARSSIGTAAATQQADLATARGLAQTASSNAAGIAAANANVTKARDAVALAAQTVARDSQLLAQGYIAQSQADADRSNFVAAQAALSGAQAAATQAALGATASLDQARASRAQGTAQTYGIETARAQARTQAADADAMAASVASVSAQVRQAELNVEKTIIRSPVDGTVVARNVSVGTTVAASLQTPTLFSIAQDLNKMEADVAVGEPDIGNVRAGENVDFTVLAYPNQTFHGTVSQVRINPVTTANVVTYTTVVLVDNRAGKLLPGMTANASIDVAKAANAFVVPIAALTYAPPTGTVAPRRRRPSTAGVGGAGAGSNAGAAPSPWGATNGSAAATVSTGSRGRIFVRRGTTVVRVPVTISLVSGTQAAVVPRHGDFTNDDAVVTSDSSVDDATPAKRGAPGNANPFAGGGGPGRGATRGIGG